MTLFRVEFLDKSGSQKTTSLEAENEDMIIELIRERGCYPLRVDLDRKGVPADPDEVLGPPPKPRASDVLDLDAFVDQCEALTAKLRRGDDDAYFELIAEHERALSLLEQLDGDDTEARVVRSALSNASEDLKALGNPGAARDHYCKVAEQEQAKMNRVRNNDMSNLEEHEFWPLASGRLEQGAEYKEGVLGRVNDFALVILDEWPSENPKGQFLCETADIARIERKGFFKKRLIVGTKGGDELRFFPAFSMMDEAQKHFLKFWINGGFERPNPSKG